MTTFIERITKYFKRRLKRLEQNLIEKILTSNYLIVIVYLLLLEY